MAGPSSVSFFDSSAPRPQPAEPIPAKPADPQSPFYRVALKAIILDDQNRMLVFRNKDGYYELPGGGWEHDEPVAKGLARELQEEAGIDIEVDARAPRFVFQILSARGYQALRMMYDAHMVDPAQPLVPADGMVAAQFVNKAELLALLFVNADEPIKQFAGEIWPGAAAQESLSWSVTTLVATRA